MVITNPHLPPLSPSPISHALGPRTQNTTRRNIGARPVARCASWARLPGPARSVGCPPQATTPQQCERDYGHRASRPNSSRSKKKKKKGLRRDWTGFAKAASLRGCAGRRQGLLPRGDQPWLGSFLRQRTNAKAWCVRMWRMMCSRKCEVRILV
jgi:hypothetical protein